MILQILQISKNYNKEMKEFKVYDSICLEVFKLINILLTLPGCTAIAKAFSQMKITKNRLSKRISDSGINGA